jgi:hypothetical protein
MLTGTSKLHSPTTGKSATRTINAIRGGQMTKAKRCELYERHDLALYIASTDDPSPFSN